VNSETYEILIFLISSSLVFLSFCVCVCGGGVEFFPITPYSQVLSICAVACLVSAYKLLYFTVSLEPFPLCALHP